ncbi:MAG: orotidine-5'-phosphate decarboxylase [Gemmatimonadota bacterium]
MIVALDQDGPEEARRCVEALGDDVGRYKLGSVLFTRAGPPLVRELSGRGLGVFLDLKFHDTPATVAGAVAAAVELGVDLLTVHAAGGGPMVEAARKAIDRAGAGTRLLAVTVLTSLGPEEFDRVAGGGRGLRESVVALARLAIEAGADGCVASAREVAVLREALGPGPLLVVPGIRPAWSVADHAGQARTASPAEAIRAGATHLVLGRAVTRAENPLAALRRIREEIAA